MQGLQIVNERGLALDVAEGKDAEGQTVLMWTSGAGSNQKWTIEYDEKLKCEGYPIVVPLTKKEETVDGKKPAEKKPVDTKPSDKKPDDTKPGEKKPADAAAPKTPEDDAEAKKAGGRKPAAAKPATSAGKAPEEPKPAEPTKGELPVPIPAGTTPL